MKYINVDSKEIVQIIGDNGNFYTLNNGMKIDKQLFSRKFSPMPDNSNEMNAENFLNTKTNITQNIPKNTPTFESNNNNNIDVVDPLDFLNTKTNFTGVENLLKIDSSQIIDLPENQRVVIKDYNSIEKEIPLDDSRKEQMIREFNERQRLLKQPNAGGIGSTVVDENDENALNKIMKEKPKPQLNENGLTEQQEFIRQQQIELTGEDPFADKIKTYQNKNQNTNPISENQPKEEIKEQPKEVLKQESVKKVIIPEVVEDPSWSVFKRFKRNHNVHINLNINDKISKPDFIKVMADGFEGDIIEFYSNEIFNSFISDTEKIKKEIYNQLYRNIFGEDEIEGEDEEDDTPKETVTGNIGRSTVEKTPNNKPKKSTKKNDK